MTVFIICQRRLLSTHRHVAVCGTSRRVRQTRPLFIQEAAIVRRLCWEHTLCTCHWWLKDTPCHCLCSLGCWFSGGRGQVYFVASVHHTSRSSIFILQEVVSVGGWVCWWQWPLYLVASLGSQVAPWRRPLGSSPRHSQGFGCPPLVTLIPMSSARPGLD